MRVAHSILVAAAAIALVPAIPAHGQEASAPRPAVVQRAPGAPARPAMVLVPADRSAASGDTVAIITPATPPGEGYGPVGSVADSRRRVAEMLGSEAGVVGLFRSATGHGGAVGGDPAPGFTLLTPRGRMVWNSALPFSRNEGTLWAGRGASGLVSAGAAFRRGAFWGVLAPEVAYHRNRDFQIFQYEGDDRSPFAHPWHTHPESLDAPMRFGDRPFGAFHLGESAVGLDFGRFSGGFGTERQWWGASEQNAVLFGYHAPGFPHLFLRTREPVSTRAGEFEGRWLAGWLQESDYFTPDPGDDLRGIAAVALSWRPPATNLWLGGTRAVYGPNSIMNPVPFRFLDVLTNPGRPNDESARDPERPPARDQMLSFFFRYLPERSGIEVYGEWALREVPRTLGDFLTQPNHGQAYTLGAAWARPVGSASALRLRTEVTYLEQSATFATRRNVGLYKSRPVPQGFTHQGRVLGAWIGTGGSSQWAALDYLADRWGIGAEAGRVRWEEDAYKQVYPFRHSAGHDVSVFGGLSGHMAVGPVSVGLQYVHSFRMNYLFQHRSQGFVIEYAEDIHNSTVRLTVEPRWRW